MTERISAGILVYRWTPRAPEGPSDTVEVLLAHPGGPYFARKDAGHWSIPKGEVEPGEALIDVALRELEEETGLRLVEPPLIPLGETRQKGGKLVHAWAAEGDLDPGESVSNSVLVELPRGSGRLVEFPEIDRVEWFSPDEARRRIKEPQAVFIDRLEAALAEADRQKS
jgi:predicted NUDIX family NTP pyrophosphohydrolase